MACSEHQLVLHLLLVMELLLQLQKTRMLKALLHLQGKRWEPSKTAIEQV